MSFGRFNLTREQVIAKYGQAYADSLPQCYYEDWCSLPAEIPTPEVLAAEIRKTFPIGVSAPWLPDWLTGVFNSPEEMRRRAAILTSPEIARQELTAIASPITTAARNAANTGKYVLLGAVGIGLVVLLSKK